MGAEGLEGVWNAPRAAGGTPPLRVVIAGAGIGGLTAALALHRAGIEAEVFEQAQEVRELGVGINLLPHAVKELAALGLLPALDRAGIRTRRLVYMNRFGQPVWEEPRGIDAGYEVPQISIHRGKLQGVLLPGRPGAPGGGRHPHRPPAGRVRGAGAGRCGRASSAAPTGAARRGRGRRADRRRRHPLGAAGAASTRTRARRPGTAIMLWRGATDWPAYADGRTMVIAGGNARQARLLPMPDPRRSRPRAPARPARSPTGRSWPASATASQPPPRREDWSRPGRLEEVLPFVRDAFRPGLRRPGRR